MSPQIELITIAVYSTPVEAHLAKTKLDSAGIESFITDEYMSHIYMSTVGGVKLQVRKSDAESAVEILETSEIGSVSEPNE